MGSIWTATFKGIGFDPALLIASIVGVEFIASKAGRDKQKVALLGRSGHTTSAAKALTM
jgi:hypothetical protein